jgi:hypothetical protein
VTIDGTSSMTVKETVLMDTIRREMYKQKLGILHRISLHHPPTVTLWKNFEVSCYRSCGVGCDDIQFHGLNHLQFQSLLSETDAEYGDILLYRSLTVELWDSVETCFSFDARNTNVHEW